MIQKYRQLFNANFNKQQYQLFLESLQEGYPTIPFRVAETPIFIPEELKEKLIAAGEEIIAFIKLDKFKSLTQNAIPQAWSVPNETAHPHFLTFDFGLCKVDNEISPMLIEMQGFPSLYGFQPHLANSYKTAYQLEDQLSPYFNGLDENTYFQLLKEVIVGDHLPQHVALMDIDAPLQKTAIDFFITAKHLGIQILSLSDIWQEGKQLYYRNNGEKTLLKRIYNRLIFDEIGEKTNIFKNSFDPRNELDVEWITHPNWFYRISKYTMPFLTGKFVPETRFLNTVKAIPNDLENYVLKPLFSFAGMGVMIEITAADIQNIKDPENWILQRKVTYEPVIQAPDGGVKAEIRMMYIWPEGGEPQLCINLARLSKGKMIGVRYNEGLDWVGGSVGLMNKI